MPILFTAIAHGTTILAKYASFVGNFIEVTEQVLEKIPAENNMMTYAHLSYFFHCLMEDNLVYLCITDDDFEQAKAFLFLSDIKTRFEKKYGATWIRVALPNNAMNSDFSPVLAAQMKRYSGSWDLEEFQEQVDEVKNIMVENIENILSRGERLDLLVKESENGKAVTDTFSKSSTNVGHSLSGRILKWYLICAIVAIAPMTYILVSLLCGGFTWSSCIGSE